jgi:hypothetical protein
MGKEFEETAAQQQAQFTALLREPGRASPDAPSGPLGRATTWNQNLRSRWRRRHSSGCVCIYGLNMPPS